MSYPNSRNAVNHYNQVDTYSAVSGADPHRLVLMLMDGALGKIATARGSMERHDIPAKGEAIGQAISIIDGLRTSLDLQSGGEIALNLDSLYDYMERRLTEANIHNDPSILEEVAGLLGEIRGAWRAIPREMRSGSRELRKASAGA
ncbi:MAG TPA: flagellar export chaperone FliS [Chromatiaceae bacterium]|nr:flagellar export chaperone FliS [Chromatiaceae bacterium]